MNLFAVELKRGLARRSTRVLLLVAVIGIAAIGLGVFLDSRAEFDPTDTGAAARERQQYIDECVGSNGFGGEVGPLAGRTVEQACEGSTGPVSDFVRDRRFHLTDLHAGPGDEGILDVTALFLVIGALIGGATYIGGEWRWGTMVTLLTWEPRRLRLFLAKVAAAAAITFVIGLLLQGLVGLAVLPAALWRGTTEGVDSEWVRGIVGFGLRASGLGVGAALVGYAVASIGRNTAAALGLAFGYVAVFEALVRGLKPGWQRWLIGENSSIFLTGAQLDTANFERPVIGAALVLGMYLAAVLAAAALLFQRRDVT